MKFLIYLFFLVTVLGVPGARAELVIANAAQPLTDLAPHLSVMVDPTTRLDIDDVIASRGPRFLPNTQAVPSFGFTRDAIWIRLEIRSEHERDLELVAKLASTRLSHFTWYAVADGRVVQAVTCGAAEGGGNGFYRLPRVKLDIPAGASVTLYARSQSNTSQWLVMRAGSPQAMNRHISCLIAWDLLLIGFNVAVAVFALLFGLVHRRKIYFHLIYFALAYLIYYLLFNGYLRLAWPQIPLWFEREGLGIICAAGLFVLTRFSRSYLGLGHGEIRVRVAQRIAEGCGLLAGSLFLLIDFFHAIRILMPLQALAICVGSFAIIWRVRNNSRPEGVGFLMTWIGYGLLVTLLGLQFSDTLRVLMPFNLIQQLIIPVILSSFLMAVISRQRSLQELELHLVEAKQAESEARLSALRYQINPHFLFNTLASIDALSRLNPALVRTLVSRLSTFLRLRLAPSANQLNPLERELDSIRAYLDIEHIRFGNALTATYDIAPASRSWPLPELLLQPLIENAVKYGFDADCHLHIRIVARVKREILVITLSNQGSFVLSEGASVSDGHGHGIGISNVRQRLALYYGDRADFQITQEGGIVVCKIKIPA